MILVYGSAAGSAVPALAASLLSALACCPGCASPPPEGRYEVGPGGAAAGAGAGGAAIAGNGASGAGVAGSGGFAASAEAGSGQSAGMGAAGGGGALSPVNTEPPYFPFPQNRQTDFCSYPEYNNADLEAAWSKWKQQAVTPDGAGGFLRVRRWGADGNDTVSEGIAYGMLAAVYMNDQATFDGLWNYSQIHLDQNGLMNWHLGPDGSTWGENGATDADEDMAWALLMAERQWGGQGSLGDSYANLARAQIDRVWLHEVDRAGGYVLKPGDTWGGRNQTNPSYFSPAYYRAFGRATGNESGWQEVIDASYSILERAADAGSGLVPAWCDDSGQIVGGDAYQYDACRVPFRLALDYCFSGESRARALLMKSSGFFSNVGAANIKDGYRLDGTASGTSSDSMAFIGPVGAGAMVDTGFAGLLGDAYSRVVELSRRDEPYIYGYFNSSVGLLSLLVMSGNFFDYTDPP